jgi:hypothetical protein
VGLLSVLRFIPIGVFDDATVHAIGRAFDLACKELNDAGQPDVVHEVMIERIIAVARRGERDLKRCGMLERVQPSNRRRRRIPPPPPIVSKHSEFWNQKR